MKPLVFFVDPAWNLGKMHTPLLYPFWGNIVTDESLFAKELYDTFPFDTSLYTITDDITKADMVMVPYRYNALELYAPGLLQKCIDVAKKANLPLFIDAVGDIDAEINIPNCYSMHIGGYRFQFDEQKTRVQVPPPADDLLVRCVGGQLQIRHKKSGKPSIGFAGWAKLSPKQWAKSVLKELPVRLKGLFASQYRAMQKGVFWRARAIKILESRPDLVETHFLVRPSFSGSVKTASGDLRTLRQEFVDTLLGSDYALDVRGDANDSARLFEILSLGKILVLVDTERNLPFKDSIDYASFSIIVDFRDIKRLPERVAEFHSKVTDEEFVAMQQRARAAFENHLRVDAQTKHIVSQLRKLLVNN